MSVSRARWIAVWVLIALWLLALALDFGGNWAHLLIVVGIGILIYELVAEEPEAT